MHAPTLLVLLGTLLTATGCDRITNSPHAAGAEQANTFFTFEELAPVSLPLRLTLSTRRRTRRVSGRFIASLSKGRTIGPLLQNGRGAAGRLASRQRAVPRRRARQSRGDLRIRQACHSYAPHRVHARCKRKVSLPPLTAAVLPQRTPFDFRFGNACDRRTIMCTRFLPPGNAAHQFGVFLIEG